MKKIITLFASFAILAVVLWFFLRPGGEDLGRGPILVPGLDSITESTVQESFHYACTNPLFPVQLRFERRHADAALVMTETGGITRANDGFNEFLCGAVSGPVLGDYLYMTLLDPNKTGTVAMRWKNEHADILLDLDECGKVSVVRMDPGEAPEKDEELAVGENVHDFLGGVEALREFARGGDSRTVICAMKKSVTSIYAMILEQDGVESVEISRRPLRCRRYTVELAYACPVTIEPGATLEDLRTSHFPKLSMTEVSALFQTITGAGTPAAVVGRTFAFPVSVAVFNRVMNRDREFEGPFGLDEHLTLWCHPSTGMPVKIRGGFHGITVEFDLTNLDY
jgi:hypothetical protein